MVTGQETAGYDFDMENPRIVVVGCGGAGCNSVHRLNRLGVHGAETVAVNTDRFHLERVNAHRKYLIGHKITRGFGAGGMPEVGERCAELAEETLDEAVRRADITFVIAGMGGGTGTGVAPFVSNLAKKNGSIVIGMATTPFKSEMGREDCARHGLERFRRSADSVIVLENERLLKVVPNLPLEQALSVMDQLISEVIKGVSEAVTKPSMINIDFADLKTIMNSGGASTIMYGENAADDPQAVVEEATSHPLLDIDYSKAKGALIHLTSGPSVSLRVMNEVLGGIASKMDTNANIIFGVKTDDKEYDGVIRAITIVTGARSSSLLGPGAHVFEPHLRAFEGIIPIIN